jgi:hypothetical protein
MARIGELSPGLNIAPMKTNRRLRRQRHSAVILVYKRPCKLYPPALRGSYIWSGRDRHQRMTHCFAALAKVALTPNHQFCNLTPELVSSDVLSPQLAPELAHLLFIIMFDAFGVAVTPCAVCRFCWDEGQIVRPWGGAVHQFPKHRIPIKGDDRVVVDFDAPVVSTAYPLGRKTHLRLPRAAIRKAPLRKPSSFQRCITIERPFLASVDGLGAEVERPCLSDS